MLKHLIGKRYEIPAQEHKTLCWSFSCYASELLGFSLPLSVWAMRCAGASPILFSVVLFHFPDNSWHTGIVWPDCVHYVHAIERLGVNYIRQDRLNHEVLQFVKGYYVNN